MLRDSFSIETNSSLLMEKGEKSEAQLHIAEMAKALKIPMTNVTPEAFAEYAANKVQWYSSNPSEKEKSDPEGKRIYGHYLASDAGYAQTYVRREQRKTVCVFNLSGAKLKVVNFNDGMTIYDQQRNELLAGGYDGFIFDGMSGPEVCLITNIAKQEGEITPIPTGFQALVDNHKPIPVKTVQAYGIQLPAGYVRRENSYIFENTEPPTENAT